MKKHFPVVQSNQVIQARYKLTRDEQKIIKILLSVIKEGDKEFGKYKLSIPETAEFMNIDRNSAYQKFKDITKKLMTRVVEIKDDEKKKYIQFSWISIAEYHDGEGALTLSIHPDLKPFFFELKKHYTKYAIQNVMQLDSTYAIRFYELGKMNIGRKQYESFMSLNDLKDWLQMKKSQYKETSKFRKYVLEPARRQINKHTDIAFDYEPVKRGRGGKIVGYNLHFKPKKNTIDSPAPESVTELLDQLKTIGITTVRSATAQKWLDVYGMDKLKVAIEVAQETHTRGKQVGAGLIAKALKEGWTGKAEQTRQEQEAIRTKQHEQIEREKAKTRVQALYKKYSQETTKIVQKWHDGLSEGDQETIKTQYQNQKPLFGSKATTDSAFYLAHLTQLYKQQYSLEGFSAWLDNHVKKKKIKMTQSMLLAVAELDR